MERGIPIRSISRAIAVLQAINTHGSLSMLDVARHGDVPYPTAVRIVQTLIAEGLVEQEPSRKRYRATVLVHSLSHGYQANNELVDASRPHMSEITRQIGWPVSLAARIGSRMVLLDSTHAETSLTFEHYYPGYTIPLLGGAAGRLCFAYMEPEERDNVQLMWEASGDDGGQILINTSESIQAICHQGYSTLGITPGRTSSVAVPIFVQGRFVAALTLLYFAAAMRQSDAVERYLPLLKSRAEAISAAVSEAAPPVKQSASCNG